MALIVEDDVAQANIFRRAVELAGYVVEYCHTGTAAKEFLTTHAPYLVVLDLHIPGVPGAELLTYLRQQPHLQATRVILATADPRLAEMLEDQSDLVLLKPVSFVQLRSLAERLRAFWVEPEDA
ncbi:MAG: response regulator [Ardenticatenia bacterium]|nr:response regulator [Ardenticatenia bacterium]